MPNYLKLVQEQDKEEGVVALDNRYQTDADLLHLTDYIMRGPPDINGVAHAIPGIVNATLNSPAIFGRQVVAALGAVKQQIIVESKDEGFDTHEIEEFQQYALDAANEKLRKKRLPALNPFADAQFCFRGGCGRRILFREEDGILIPDIMNWDRRYIQYQMGEEGLSNWAGLLTDKRFKVLRNS